MNQHPRVEGGRLPAVEIVGGRRRPLSDLYHHLMNAPWWQVVSASATGYVTAIALFAAGFRLGGDCIQGARPGSWIDAFWFSVQTFSTIGYGGMSPGSSWANALVTLESWVGLSGVAVATALLYAKFARPTARVAFASTAVVAYRHGVPTLQIRLANERKSPILDARIEVSALVDDLTPEGQYLRRLVRLPLERDQLPVFTVTLTAIHAIGPDSPLRGFAEGSSEHRVIFLLITFAGTDDSLMQQVYARHVYTPEQIRIGHTYDDMVEATSDRIRLHLPRLSAISPQGAGTLPARVETAQVTARPAPVRASFERRAAARYVLDPPVPALFGGAQQEIAAGQIVDISEGGVRISAAPGIRLPPWGERLEISVSLSSGEGEASLQGFSLGGRLVRAVVDERGAVLQIRFDRDDPEWTQLQSWVRALARGRSD